MKFISSIFAFHLLFLNPIVKAQEIKPSATFIEDSIQLGDVVTYILKAEYSREKQVLFPDSTYDFSPFQVISKTYYNTYSDSLKSVDSVVYQLTTFSIDSMLSLEVPIIELLGSDSISRFSNEVTLFFKTALSEEELAAPEIKVEENTSLVETIFLRNRFLILLIAIIVFLLFIIGIAVFNQPLVRYIKKKRLMRDYKKFSTRYHQLVNKSKAQPSFAEDALTLWKKYVEKLEKKPYTKLSRKEILQIKGTQEIKKELEAIERYIYGSKQSDIERDLRSLLHFSEKQLHAKINNLKLKR